MSKIITASILAADFANLAQDCHAALDAGVNWLHIDVMDNHYVPNLSFGADICKSLRKAGINAPMDVHLMVADPEKYIQRFAPIQPEVIFIHPETCSDLNSVIEQIKNINSKVGLVYNPDQAVELDADLLQNIDYILIMSVFPGFAGQKFIPDSVAKIKNLKQHLQTIDRPIKIAVDGGVNTNNFAELASAGAEVFILGSALFGSADYSAVLRSCRDH